MVVVLWRKMDDDKGRLSSLRAYEPRPQDISEQPTRIRVRVQQRDTALQTDLAWHDVAPDVADVRPIFDDHLDKRPDIVMWTGTVTFRQTPEVGRFRLLIEEHEYISANYTLSEGHVVRQPGRLIYAEVFELDDALVSET